MEGEVGTITHFQGGKGGDTCAGKERERYSCTDKQRYIRIDRDQYIATFTFKRGDG